MTSEVARDATHTTPLSADEIVALSREYTLYEWVAQSSVEPLPVATARGSYFYTADGRRFLDFNSQSMSVNIGHGDQRVIDAIAAQAQRLAFASPFLAHEPRARLGRKLAQLTPGDLDVTFFTNGGADANENAIKLARQVTGRHKVLARYRSYHGATGVAIAATGDPRRWAAEAGVAGIVRAPDFHKWGRPEPEPVERALQELEDVVMYEGGHTIAGLHPRAGRGRQRRPHPAGRLPPGRARDLRPPRHPAHRRRGHDRLRPNGPLVRRGALGRRAGPADDGQGPDLVVRAARRGGHAPARRGGLPGTRLRGRPHVQQPSRGLRRSPGGHRVMEQDGLVERSARLGEVMRGHHERLAERHPSVGGHRNLGLFGVLDLVRDRRTYEPLAPYDGTSEEMRAIHGYLREHGLYTFLRYHMIHTNPPLSVSEEELTEGFDIIDGVPGARRPSRAELNRRATLDRWAFGRARTGRGDDAPSAALRRWAFGESERIDRVSPAMPLGDLHGHPRPLGVRQERTNRPRGPMTRLSAALRALGVRRERTNRPRKPRDASRRPSRPLFDRWAFGKSERIDRASPAMPLGGPARPLFGRLAFGQPRTNRPRRPRDASRRPPRPLSERWAFGESERTDHIGR